MSAARPLGPRATAAGVLVGIGLLMLWTLLPLLYLVVLSVKPEAMMLDPPSLRFAPTLERYVELLRWGTLGTPIWNSLVTAVAGTAGALLLGATAALGFALHGFRGRGTVFFVILLTRMFPPVTTLIPLYLIMRTLGLLDTRTGLIVLFAALQLPLVMWIVYASLGTIPREMLETTVLDGASLPVVAARVVFPLAAPGLVSAAILSFIFCWNDFLLPLVMTSTEARTGTVALMRYTETYKTVLWGPLSTVAIAMATPTILFVLGLRQYLVKGLTAGMLKG
ncbi:MAG: carbohydrate ABC transporter permease [Armatimonadota bacterium]|nr:carbohydrate ABC transporter permease [Armatimonadota bacterium]